MITLGFLMLIGIVGGGIFTYGIFGIVRICTPEPEVYNPLLDTPDYNQMYRMRSITV